MFFVIRHKENIRYKAVRERSLPEKTAQNVLIYEKIELGLPATSRTYYGRLRRIAVWNDEHVFTVELLTNNFSLSAYTVAEIYQGEMKYRNILQNPEAAAAHQKLHRNIA